jgi:hypothetical protein
VLGPRDEIGGGESVEEGLFLIARRVGGKNPELFVENGALGVGIPTRENRVPRMASPFLASILRGKGMIRAKQDCC